MQIIDNKALLISTKYPDKITSSITKSKVVQRYTESAEVLVSWGFEEAKQLSELNIKNVPSPIERDYDWPGQYTPMEHQECTFTD